ncbi:TPA: hypothetical protein ACH3X3_007799 [Trebouxia sp. C0006]
MLVNAFCSPDHGCTMVVLKYVGSLLQSELLQVAYSTLNPGEDRLYLTYHNHCWIFRELVTGRRISIGKCQAVFAQKDYTQKVCIQAPPLLAWQDSHHAGFPKAFRLSTRMLLFCHSSFSKQLQVDPCDLPMHSCIENRNNNLPDLDGKHASCDAMLPDRKRSHADSLKTWEDTKRFQCLKLPDPLLQSTLGCIPMHVLKDIVQLSAPTDVWQDAGCPGACPDILPALAPCEVMAQVYEDSI